MEALAGATTALVSGWGDGTGSGEDGGRLLPPPPQPASMAPATGNAKARIVAAFVFITDLTTESSPQDWVGKWSEAQKNAMVGRVSATEMILTS